MNSVLKFLMEYKEKLDKDFLDICKGESSCYLCPAYIPAEEKCNRL